LVTEYYFLQEGPPGFREDFFCASLYQNDALRGNGINIDLFSPADLTAGCDGFVTF